MTTTDPQPEPPALTADPTDDPAEEPAKEPVVDLPEIAWRRLSRRMLLVHPVREIGRYIPVLFAIVVFGRHNGNSELWALAGAAAVITASVMRWATTGFRITHDQIQLRTGLFRRRILTAPADRVRTVDVTEHALHRVLGLARVSIGTGTSDERKSGLVLDGLTKAEALSLRGELLHRPPTPASPAPIHQEIAADERELLRFDPAWIRFAPFTLSGLFTVLAIFGVAVNSLNQSGTDARSIGAVRTTTRHLESVPLWLAIVQSAISLLVVVSVLSILGYILAFWNFRLSRHAAGTLHVTRGLITARSTSIEDRRLRGVEVSEPLLLRAVGGARLLAVATGLRVGRGSARGGSILAPPAPHALVTALAEAVLAERAPAVVGSAAVAGTLRPHNAQARRRRVTRAVWPWLLLSAGLGLLYLAGAPGWLPLVTLMIAVLGVPLGLDRYRALGHDVTGGFLVTRYGSLVRRRVLVETDGIIGWNQRQTFFQRRAGVVTLTATTAAGAQKYRVQDITPLESVRVAAAATPALLDQFRR